VAAAAFDWRYTARTDPNEQSLIDNNVPGDAVGDDELVEVIAANLATYGHPTSTVPMGGADDPRAVVDSQAAVHGLSNVRVIDASIIPDIPAALMCADGGVHATHQRPGVVLGTHFRPLVGHHGFGGGGVVQLPCVGSTSGAGAVAGWSVPIWPAVCCTVAAGAGEISWWAAKSAAWSAIPLSL
jgi:hypothetical protein